MKLNLASGQMYLDGYLNVDNASMYSGNMKIDINADIFTLHQENNTVEEIILSHFAMYINLKEMEMLLKRWYGWLKKDGKIIIETGNVKNIAKNILTYDNPDEINGPSGLMQLFGWESTAGHKWAWCPETLGSIMFNVGFKDIQVGDGFFHKNPSRDFLIVGIK